MSDAEPYGSTATGRVSWFDPAKRFGFVKVDDGVGDVFLHFDALKAVWICIRSTGNDRPRAL